MKLRNLVLGCMIAVLGVMTLSRATSAITCPPDSLRDGDSANSLAECNVPKEEEGKGFIIRVNTIINVLISLVGIVAVAVMVYAGIVMATSQGESAKVARARAAMIYGVVGLIICILAFAIVNFVLAGVFGDTSET